MKQLIKLISSAFLMIILLPIACKKEEVEDKPTPNHITWNQLPSLSNIFREEASSFSIGAKAYFGLGFGNMDGRYRVNVTYHDDFWEFNSTTNVWRRLADFPGNKRSGATSFALNGRGYIAFGYSTTCPAGGGPCDFTYYDDVWEYNPLTNTWTKVANFSKSSIRYARGFVINNKAYILLNNEFYEFDSSAYSFRKRTGCPIGAFSGVFSLNNKGYVFLGDPDVVPIPNKSVYEYDPVTDTWNKKRDFPGQPRILPVSFSLNEFGYCGGGYRRSNPNQYLKDLWQYNSTTDEWTQIEDYPGIGSVWLQSVLIGDKAVIGSGYGYATNQFLYDNNFWIFQPK